MPGPFPGMDPHLEHPWLWPGVHQGIMTFCASALNATLPTRYVAALNERVYITGLDPAIVPDIAVRLGSTSQPHDGGAIMAEVGDAPLVVEIAREEIRESFVEIVTTGSDERVIAVIEVLSSANKAAGSVGRRLYLAKQRRILRGDAHLLEIDLLRRGKHTVVAPREQLARNAFYDYLACLSRADARDRCEYWPIAIRRPLPKLRVPLLADDPDIVVDLQAVFDRCYDEGAFARRIDYSRKPSSPFSPADQEWAAELLKGRGFH